MGFDPAETRREAERASRPRPPSRLARLVDAAWMTVGLGFVPALMYALLGAILFVPMRDEGRHCLRLAREVLRPTGSRVVDAKGRTALRYIPELVWDAFLRLIDPNEDLDFDDLERERRGGAPFKLVHIPIVIIGLALYVLHVTWFAVPLALAHLVVGIVQVLSVVGAVFGLRHLALIPVAFFPFGFFIERDGAAPWKDVSGEEGPRTKIFARPASTTSEADPSSTTTPAHEQAKQSVP